MEVSIDNKCDNMIDRKNIPKHIAIIMDGNGRWAKQKKLPRIAGHKAGVEALRDVIKTASSNDIKYLTLYAFSTENWKRPKSEVNALMDLLVYYLRKEVSSLHKNNVKINIIGDISKFPDLAIKEINKAIDKTNKNTGLVVNIALNYGSRDELINVVKLIGEKLNNNEVTLNDINENLISNFLYTKNIPDPDLIIRTSGEKRLSNFLLWQAAYSELFFTKVYWPDFKSNNFIEAIKEYQNRTRRFGGL